MEIACYRKWRTDFYRLRTNALLLTSAVSLTGGLSASRKIGVALAAVFYVVAGALHFIKTDAYLSIVPPYIPWHLAMVRISGIAEILGGLGLLLPQTRRSAAWGIIALLIAVFPANVYMATNPIEAGAVSIAPILRWGRLPLQFLLGWWLLWCSKKP